MVECTLMQTNGYIVAVCAVTIQSYRYVAIAWRLAGSLVCGTAATSDDLRRYATFTFAA